MDCGVALGDVIPFLDDNVNLIGCASSVCAVISMILMSAKVENEPSIVSKV